MLKKQTILRIKNVYTANAFAMGGRHYVGAGSETEPDVRLFDMATGTSEHLENCPGGMMGIIPVPGMPQNLVSIMGLFPPFIGNEAGIYSHRKSPEGWETSKVLDLPFAHRCEFLPDDKRNILVAATVSKYKKDPADWSRPGEIHTIPLEKIKDGHWQSQLISSAITRNHGMSRSTVNGVEQLYISGSEGIFSVSLSPEGSFALVPLFEKEVSEMTLIDLDGDGNSELVTIEPFHGDTLNIYKRIGEEWKLKFRDSISFGHGLSSGFFNGVAVIMAGNRNNTLALESFTINDLNKGSVNRTIIEENAGPTQTQVFTFGDTDYILSANQRKHEVALYSGSLID
jgi:hypothetical protein